MKIRSGFVSNSSSSSFIVTGNMKVVAKHMLKVIEEDAVSYNKFDEDNLYLKRIQNQIKNLEKITNEQSIAFSSCNYDSFLVQKDNKVYI